MASMKLLTKHRYIKRSIAAFLAIAAVSCAAPVLSKGGRLAVAVTVVSPFAPVSASRMLTPDSSVVDIEVLLDSAGGQSFSKTRLTAALNAQNEAEATGTIEVPLGVPIVIVATVPDQAGNAVSRAESAVMTIDQSSAQSVGLTPVPLPGNPELVDIASGANAVSVPAGASRILRFSAASAGANLKWAMSSYPDLKYQVRDAAGGKLKSLVLAASAGIVFATPGSGSHYAVVYNSGTADANSVPFTLEMTSGRLTAVNASGNAYVSINGTDWAGPFATGLSSANDIAYADGLFVAVGQIGSNAGLATSADGGTWAAQNLGGSSAQLTRVAANPAGQLVTTRYYGATVDTFSSIDGLVWTGPAASGVAGGVVGPAWTAGYWFIANGNLSAIRRAADGASWATSGSSSMYQPIALIGVNNRLIIGGGAPTNANKQTVTSSDAGATFSALVNVAAAGYYIHAFAANPTTYRVLSVGSGAAAQINYSDDYGASWTTSTGSGANAFRSAAWWKGGFLAGDSAGGIYASADGAAFALAATVGADEIRGIAYDGAP